MKNPLRPFLTLAIILTFADLSFAQWTPAGLTGTNVTSLGVDGTSLFAGSYTNSGIYVSANGGASWTQVYNDGSMNTVYSISSNGTSCFAGTDVGVLTSTDGGYTWHLSSGIPAEAVYAVAPTGSNVYCGTYYSGGRNPGGLFLSTNAGSSWSQMNLQEGSVNALLPGSDMIAAGCAGGIWISTNGGTSWTSGYNGTTDALAANGTDLFAGTYSQGVLLSTDNGATWKQINTGLAGTKIVALESSGANVYASTGTGVFVTTDNGASWTAVDSGLSNRTIHALAVIADSLYAGTDNGVYAMTISQSSSSGSQAQAGLAIYDTTLESPWMDASWAATVSYTDSNMISVNAGTWGALSLNHGDWNSQIAVTPSSYQSLDFSFRGTTPISIILQTAAGSEIGCVDTSFAGAGWTSVSIPMTELDQNGSSFTRISFQSDAGSPTVFYMRSIGLASAGQPIAAASRTNYPTADAPLSFKLEQNYPNPFNPTTAITYQLSAASKVTLKVYDVLGREVATLVNGEESEGTHSVTFDGSRLASGVYLYRLTAGNHVFIKKMLMIK